jgi:hypothetical protein
MTAEIKAETKQIQCMKIVCTLRETQQFLAEELAKYNNVSSKKRLVNKWIKQSESHVNDIVNAVENCKGWLHGEIYHSGDIMREKMILQYLKQFYLTL